jgi:SAM-dependent methyltransferase
MTEWFRESFDADYLSMYSHRTDQEAELAVGMIQNVSMILPGARVLDAPCGAGRHSRAFSRHGMQVAGLDLSADLLRVAYDDNGPTAHVTKSAKAYYVRGDLRQLPYREGTFDLVANLFSSIGYFETDRENAAMLCGLIRVCKPGGVIVIDFMNAPQIRKHLQPHSSHITDNGIKINSSRKIQGIPPRVVKVTNTESPDGEARTFLESVRLFEPEELREIMQRCGAPVFDIRGNYAGNAYTAESERVVLFGRKK